MTPNKIIYVWGDFGPDSVTGSWSANTFEDESAEPFASMAVLAMAYDTAAARVQQCAEEYAEFSTTSDEACQQLGQAAQAVTFLTPQDAIAAFERELRRARNDAIEAVAEKVSIHMLGRNKSFAERVVSSIRAMKEDV